MFSRYSFFVFIASLLVCVCAAVSALAQESAPRTATPLPSPTPSVDEAQDGQDAVKVLTEEVRIPIFATDEEGRFDPSLEIQDILVLEDNVPQEIRSVRRIPASILLLVGTGGELNPAIRTSTTRAVARNLVANIREGDHVAVLQFSSRTELVHGWTEDKESLHRSLRSKLLAGRGSRLSQAIIEAARFFESQPVGNRHLVLITDGVETPSRLDYKEAIKVLNAGNAPTPEAQAEATEAVRQLNATQATVHIISYTAIGQRVSKEQAEKTQEALGIAQSRADMATVGIDPTRPPGTRGSGINPPQVNGGIRFDPQMRKLRQAYERALKRSEQRLTSFAEETGGRMWLPVSADEMYLNAKEVAREIGSQYVITYQPKRPLENAPPNEYRRLVVAPRRIGLRLRARRGYVVAAVR
ncbi:MAG TPA: VWA domain-containing protein [Pyrinomonadaceae bacterium]|jgi:VWFA-related protein